MMKIKLLLFSLFIQFSAFCQTKLPELTLKNPEDVTDYISRYYKLNDDTLCLKTAIFIKFGLTEKGEISSLSFTKNSPKVITDALSNAIMLSNGHWKINKRERNELKDKLFIIPFIVDYLCGCNSEKKNGNETTNQQAVYKSILSAKSNDALRNLLIFEDQEFYKLNCIILPPLSVGCASD